MGRTAVTFRYLAARRGSVLSEAIRAAYGDTYDVRWVYDAGRGRGPTGGRHLRLLGRRVGGWRAALPRGDEPGGGRRRRRPLGPGGDDAGGPRPAPLHPHQAAPDGLGDRARPGGDVQRGDRGPPLQPARQPRARRPRDGLPARLDPGLGLQRRGDRPAPPPPVGGALLHEAERRPRARGLRAGAPPRDRAADAGAVRAARHPRRPAGRRRAARANRPARGDRRGPQPGPAHRPRAGRRPGDRRSPPSATTSSTARASTPSTSTSPWRTQPRPSWPTTWSASASPTPASSPTTAPTATSSACNPSTEPASPPTTSPSPPTTAASCSTTCWPISGNGGFAALIFQIFSIELDTIEHRLTSPRPTTAQS